MQSWHGLWDAWDLDWAPRPDEEVFAGGCQLFRDLMRVYLFRDRMQSCHGNAIICMAVLSGGVWCGMGAL
jgi:hypothetical protein